MGLRGKKILITAGPTWVPIDSIRIISNIATGATGILIARDALNHGARVTLLLGPIGICNLNKPRPFYYKKTLHSKKGRGKSIRIVRFCFFDELKKILKRELKNNKYDIIIHSAAISDFYPVRRKSPKEKGLSNGVKSDCRLKGKLSSGRVYNLRLVPLEKLIIQIRQLACKAKLVMFKLESTVTDKILIQRARRAKDMVGADLIVANCLKPYRAFIIDRRSNQTQVKSKRELAKKLINILHNF